MEDELKTKAAGAAAKDITIAAAPDEGTDFYATFDTFGATIIGISGGGVTAAKLERKILGKTVKQSVASKRTEIDDVVFSYERGTGTIPALRTKGTLVIFDAGAGTKTTYANAVLYKIDGVDAQAGAITEGKLTFLLNELGVETTWTSSTGYT